MLFMSRFRSSTDGEAINLSPPRHRGRQPVIGLALGGGAARGWSHIGILRVLEEAGLRPQVVTGTSIGAVVGGCWAAGKLDELDEFARSLTKRRVFGMMDFSLAGYGLISGDRIRKRLEEGLANVRIETLPLKFASVATEIATGHEVWVTDGDLIKAMRASYAIPGVFEPVKVGGRWLVDGVLVNPIPVTTARALGADLVIAVNLNSDIFGRSTIIHNHGHHKHHDEEAPIDPQREPGLFGPVLGAANLLKRSMTPREDGSPGIASVMIDSFNITQDRIARSRLAGDPPDVTIGPKLGNIGLVEFHRADEAIAIGADAARRLLPEIKDCFEALTAQTMR